MLFLLLWHKGHFRAMKNSLQSPALNKLLLCFIYCWREQQICNNFKHIFTITCLLDRKTALQTQQGGSLDIGSPHSCQLRPLCSQLQPTLPCCQRPRWLVGPTPESPRPAASAPQMDSTVRLAIHHLTLGKHDFFIIWFETSESLFAKQTEYSCFWSAHFSST